MAKPKYYKQKKCFRVDFLNDNRKVERRLFKDRDTAWEFYYKLQDRKERIKNNLVYTDDVLFEDAAGIFETKYLVTQSKTYRITETNRLNLIAEHFKGRLLSQITESDIEDYILKRKKRGVSNKSINNELYTISRLFRFSIPRKYATTNPVTKDHILESLPTYTNKPLSDFEIQKLYDHLCDCCLLTFTILLNTGIRMGEMENITRDNFDLNAKVLRLYHTEETPLKGKEDRIIPLNEEILGIVEDLPPGKVMRITRKVFHNHYQRTCKKLGIKTRIHALRHTFCTKLVGTGLDLFRCMKITGHKDVKTLERYVNNRIDANLVSELLTQSFSGVKNRSRTGQKSKNRGENPNNIKHDLTRFNRHFSVENSNNSTISSGYSGAGNGARTSRKAS